MVITYDYAGRTEWYLDAKGKAHRNSYDHLSLVKASQDAGVITKNIVYDGTGGNRLYWETKDTNGEQDVKGQHWAEYNTLGQVIWQADHLKSNGKKFKMHKITEKTFTYDQMGNQDVLDEKVLKDSYKAKTGIGKVVAMVVAVVAVVFAPQIAVMVMNAMAPAGAIALTVSTVSATATAVAAATTAAIGSFSGTLIDGGSFGDALKAGAITFATTYFQAKINVNAGSKFSKSLGDLKTAVGTKARQEAFNQILTTGTTFFKQQAMLNVGVNLLKGQKFEDALRSGVFSALSTIASASVAGNFKEGSIFKAGDKSAIDWKQLGKEMKMEALGGLLEGTLNSLAAGQDFNDALESGMANGLGDVFTTGIGLGLSRMSVFSNIQASGASIIGSGTTDYFGSTINEAVRSNIRSQVVSDIKAMAYEKLADKMGDKEASFLSSVIGDMANAAIKQASDAAIAKEVKKLAPDGGIVEYDGRQFKVTDAGVEVYSESLLPNGDMKQGFVSFGKETKLAHILYSSSTKESFIKNSLKFGLQEIANKVAKEGTFGREFGMALSESVSQNFSLKAFVDAKEVITEEIKKSGNENANVYLYWENGEIRGGVVVKQDKQGDYQMKRIGSSGFSIAMAGSFIFIDILVKEIGSLNKNLLELTGGDQELSNEIGDWFIRQVMSTETKDVEWMKDGDKVLGVKILKNDGTAIFVFKSQDAEGNTAWNKTRLPAGAIMNHKDGVVNSFIVKQEGNTDIYRPDGFMKFRRTENGDQYIFDENFAKPILIPSGKVLIQNLSSGDDPTKKLLDYEGFVDFDADKSRFYLKDAFGEIVESVKVYDEDFDAYIDIDISKGLDLSQLSKYQLSDGQKASLIQAIFMHSQVGDLNLRKEYNNKNSDKKSTIIGQVRRLFQDPGLREKLEEINPDFKLIGDLLDRNDNFDELVKQMKKNTRIASTFELRNDVVVGYKFTQLKSKPIPEITSMIMRVANTPYARDVVSELEKLPVNDLANAVHQIESSKEMYGMMKSKGILKVLKGWINQGEKVAAWGYMDLNDISHSNIDDVRDQVYSFGKTEAQALRSVWYKELYSQYKEDPSSLPDEFRNAGIEEKIAYYFRQKVNESPQELEAKMLILANDLGDIRYSVPMVQEAIKLLAKNFSKEKSIKEFSERVGMSQELSARYLQIIPPSIKEGDQLGFIKGVPQNLIVSTADEYLKRGTIKALESATKKTISKGTKQVLGTVFEPVEIVLRVHDSAKNTNEILDDEWLKPDQKDTQIKREIVVQGAGVLWSVGINAVKIILIPETLGGSAVVGTVVDAAGSAYLDETLGEWKDNKRQSYIQENKSRLNESIKADELRYGALYQGYNPDEQVLVFSYAKSRYSSSKAVFYGKFRDKRIKEARASWNSETSPPLYEQLIEINREFEEKWQSGKITEIIDEIRSDTSPILGGELN